MLALANGSLIEMHTPRHWALTIEGRASQGQLAEMYGVRKASVQQWIRNFESMV